MKNRKQKEERPPKQGAPQMPKHPPIPKTRDMRKIVALRVLLWVVIGVILFRGLAAILFPTDTRRLYDSLSGGIARVESSIASSDEACAFAESFAREYFTYTERGTEDYKKRLKIYCSSRLADEICEGIMLKGGAKVTYASAVKIASYSETQQDITVLVVADYITKKPTIEDGKEFFKEVVVSATTYLTVPVYISASGYLVEDIPLVTSPPPQASDYTVVEYAGVTADERVKQLAESMLGDFFKTLYSEEQRRIDYYLTETANKQRLREIKGSIQFERIESISMYTIAANSYMGIVTLRLMDTAGTPIKQRLNISLVESGSRMYVSDINLRSHNIGG